MRELSFLGDSLPYLNMAVTPETLQCVCGHKHKLILLLKLHLIFALP